MNSSFVAISPIDGGYAVESRALVRIRTKIEKNTDNGRALVRIRTN